MDEFMLPCLNKKLFGLECPGCGAQRAAAFLFDGEFVAAFKMYPAIYPLLLLALFLLVNIFAKFKYSEKIKVTLIILSIVFILTNYIFKFFTNH